MQIKDIISRIYLKSKTGVKIRHFWLNFWSRIFTWKPNYKLQDKENHQSMIHNPVGTSNIGINRRRHYQFRQPYLEKLLKNFVKSKRRKNFVKSFLTFNWSSVKISMGGLTVKSWFTLTSITAQNPSMALLKNALKIVKNRLANFNFFMKINKTI